MKRLLLTIYAVISTLSAFACECAYTPFLKEVARSEEIFIGKILYKNNTEGLNFLSYHLSVLQTFKGEKSDTINITTGFGGSDCGMDFEIGQTYIVYAYNKATGRCGRTALVEQATDLEKLKYLFQTGFAADIGKTANPILTNNEAEYFNLELSTHRGDFDFHQKKVAFFLENNFNDKEQYFKDFGEEPITKSLVVLTIEEKTKYSNYDAIVVSSRKHRISSGYRKRIIKKLKNHRLVYTNQKRPGATLAPGRF